MSSDLESSSDPYPDAEAVVAKILNSSPVDISSAHELHRQLPVCSLRSPPCKAQVRVVWLCQCVHDGCVNVSTGPFLLRAIPLHDCSAPLPSSHSCP